MKVVKVKFNPNKIASNPEKSFDIFSQKILKSAQRGQKVDLSGFSNELYQLGDSFEAINKKELMNKRSKQLAENLVRQNLDSMAGAIYSFLIKFNKGNFSLVEEFATSALAIAKRLNDPMHVMARCNDLREIYKILPPKDDKFMKVLYEEKRALGKIVNDYDGVKKRYNTVNREMKPRDNYRILLADVKFEIGKRQIGKDDKLALQELSEAKAMYEELGISDKISCVEEFMNSLD